MTNQELYPPTETTKERFSSWRKPLAVTAMGIAALSACSSDVEARQDPTEPTAPIETEAPEPSAELTESTEPTNEENDNGNSSENDGWDPEAYEGPRGRMMFSENQSAELMERMGFPFPDCAEAAEGEVCTEEYHNPGYILHNGADIVTEWAQEQGSDSFDRIIEMHYLPQEESHGFNDYDVIIAYMPLEE